jgi:hypothetical protein
MQANWSMQRWPAKAPLQKPFPIVVPPVEAPTLPCQPSLNGHAVNGRGHPGLHAARGA